MEVPAGKKFDERSLVAAMDSVVLPGVEFGVAGTEGEEKTVVEVEESIEPVE